jgi:transglutaminase-like putative cysteine protease
MEKDQYMNKVITLNPSTLIEATPILNYHAENIQQLIRHRGWDVLEKSDAARAIYEFCRDEILFGYNSDADNMSASRVLEEGLGHCNTKATLLMALLRAIGIPCRLHAFTIHKRLQRGALTRFVYLMAPKEIIHTWTEIKLGEDWIALEGLILDKRYLTAIQNKFPDCTHPFSGFAIATPDLQRPQVEWTGKDTFIQREGIAREFGMYNSPDEFYAEHQTNLRGLKGWLYHHFFYKSLNKNIKEIRESVSPINTKTETKDTQCLHPK